ncbi:MULTISPECIES: ABC transporter ATP-binding protein [Glaesserella]|uniref:ABC transporter ATP-binding protein n=1 Tax=Glaesserella australis TaxID=2094024 RepID=A0A328BXW7_9PAST|nr:MULTISPECIES: ABC transporter ATP-binding protein [Glaesserella]AUI65993.1 iron ABC transporter ATP-binding protein [Glaesserella sp. 15-184]RAL18287.1 ABC transporter ATP-binding protein [Glaesserella australis]
MKPLITTENLTIGYGKQPLISDIHFQLKSQEICCILGANGAGKSTFLRTLLGIQPSLQGQIWFDNQPLASYSQQELAQQIAYVPQAHQSLFPFSVKEMVLMGRSAYLKWYQTPAKTDEQIALQALETMQIAHLAPRYYHQLSGGEKQLVLIARAIAQQAKLLIMDEPASSLDFGNQIRLLEQIKRLRQQQIALLITTHSPQQAHYLADSIVILDKQRSPAFLQGEKKAMLTLEQLAQTYKIEADLLAQHLPF